MLISDPKARAEAVAAKRGAILRFLRDETWSVPEILGRVAGISTRQGIHTTLKAMERDELVKYHSLPIAGRRDLPLWGITPHGLAMSWSDGEEYQDRPRFEPSRLTLSRVPHQIDLQRARLAAEAAGWRDWVRGERLGYSVPMRPDAVATSSKGVTVAIEVERTIKTKSRYQQIIANHLQAIAAGRWVGVYYLTPEGMAERLQRVMEGVGYIIENGERIELNDTHRRRFRFLELAAFPESEGNQ
ncbi:MobC family replication-relaxation protein [Pseudomonas aeruginosa]